MALITLWKQAWLNFKLRTCDVLAPEYGAMLIKARELADQRKLKVSVVNYYGRS